MSASLTLPSSELAKLSAAMRTLVAATGRGSEEITRAFAGRILKRWAGRTKVATVSKTDLRTRIRANSVAGTRKFGDGYSMVTINSGRRGGVPGLVWGSKKRLAGRISGEVFTPANRHWSSEHWHEISMAVGKWVDYVARFGPAARRSIGLARQSVVQIADQLGIDLAAVPGSGLSGAGLAKARAALASNGQKYLNGQGYAYRTSSRFFLELTNSFPKNVRMGMDAVLAGVISGEVKYYEKNLEHGVFLSAAQTARAYPFLRVAA